MDAADVCSLQVQRPHILPGPVPLCSVSGDGHILPYFPAKNSSVVSPSLTDGPALNVRLGLPLTRQDLVGRAPALCGDRWPSALSRAVSLSFFSSFPFPRPELRRSTRKGVRLAVNMTCSTGGRAG